MKLQSQTATDLTRIDGKQMLSAQQVLRQALKVYRLQGVEPAAEFLTNATKGDVAPGVRAVLLMQLASSIQQSDPEPALSLVGKAVVIDPACHQAWLLSAVLQDRLGHRDAAYRAALRVVGSPTAGPDQVLISANLLVRFGGHALAMPAAKLAFLKLNRPLHYADSLLYIALRSADWEAAEELIGQISAAHEAGQVAEVGESPRTHLLWCADEAINISVVRAWSVKNIVEPLAQLPRPVPDTLQGRSLRVGYLSSDFREHPTARLINGLFRHHDREKFELFLYCSGWDDDSELRREVLSHFDHVHVVTHLKDEAAAALIRSHKIDVLVELNGPTRANRMAILAHRPAPVQIDYLGWPGSVGGRVVDYVVGDAYTVPPGAEENYPEKVIRLHKIYQVNDYAARSRFAAPTRAEVGLPDGDVRILGMFNAINKVRGDVWSAWMQILRAQPNALLWILDPGPAAWKNIASATQSLGVDPSRILVAPSLKQQAHLRRLKCCDLMLDPWPYGGHTSTSDALFAGVPVITMEGKNFVGRVSGGLLRAAGLGTLVQPDVGAYVNMAIRLLREPAELQRIRRFILQQVPRSDVFNARSKARQLEAAYRVAVERAVKGLAPKHLTLKIAE